MRATVAKRLRKAVYTDSTTVVKYTVSPKGELLNNGTRKDYLASKDLYKDLKSKGKNFFN